MSFYCHRKKTGSGLGSKVPSNGLDYISIEYQYLYRRPHIQTML